MQGVLSKSRAVLLQARLHLLGKSAFEVHAGAIVQVATLGALEPNVLTRLLLTLGHGGSSRSISISGHNHFRSQHGVSCDQNSTIVATWLTPAHRSSARLHDRDSEVQFVRQLFSDL